MLPTKLIKVLGLLSLLFCPMGANACLWDNDTLEAEAKGLPDTVRVITGRFERNPDLYYEMRLARVEKELQSRPEDLALYDDAGVACDRLRRGDKAVAWMEKKRAMMASGGGTKVLEDHRYRYLANQGTFVAHRWLRNGADRSKIGEMKRARDLIAAAIKLNPDAHFGREKYQLQAMDWIVTPPRWQAGYELPDFIGLHKHMDVLHDGESRLKKLGMEDAIAGLSGLISLGDAWQSVDVFYALKLALMLKGDTSVAYLANFRLKELLDDGKTSLHPSASNQVNVSAIIAPDSRLTLHMGLSPQRHVEEQLPKLFRQLRAEADEWHAQRTAYMVERLRTGLHPDTDKAFWNDWQQPPAPSLYLPSAHEERLRRTKYVSIGATISAVVIFSILLLRLTRRKR